MAISITTGFSALMSGARLTQLQSYQGPLKFVFYSGTAPTNADTDLSNNTVLVTMTLKSSAPNVGNVNYSPRSHIEFAFSDASYAASAAGDISFGRLIDSATPPAVILQGSVGTSNSDFIFSSLTVALNQAVSPSTFSLNES